MGIVELESILYRGNKLANVPFNRLSILTVEAVVSSIWRGHRLTERDIREVVKFINGNLRRFTIIDAEACWDEFLRFWEEAAIAPTGPNKEFMVTVLMEIYASFNVLTSAMKQSDIVEMLVRAYPRMPGLPVRDNARATSTPDVELSNAYSRSQTYLSMFATEDMTKLINAIPWAIPWIVVSHMDYRLVDALLEGLLNIANAGTTKQQGGTKENET